MAIFKCKMCGGDLNIQEGASVVECEYCGTNQTVSCSDDEKRVNLYNRANRLRMQGEFDKAAGVYESIVAEFPEEAEAYWCLVLCKYGIEYVDDPATAKKIPTCHRSSFDSVLDDSNFELVMEYSDTLSRSVYRAEAKIIEELRKNIIEVSSKEEPYDIFICYKETAENGDRTIDSVIAQDVYSELANKGYRVFFSRITLEDKLGQEYEPYIFAALNSAKIMLAFGSDYEYYNAVWVKNEWSRFLQLIAKGEKKTLIPCYKDIDAYDMPKEFAKLQAQDMGKVGAIQDLLRGIEKILPKESSNKESGIVNNGANNPTVDSLLERAFMFLEDEEWDSANEYCEKVLDIEPKNARAYLGKLMVDLKVCSFEKIGTINHDFSENSNYKKILKYADDELKLRLSDLETKIKKSIDDIYNAACTLMKDKTLESSIKAVDLFDSIINYKDCYFLKEDSLDFINFERKKLEDKKFAELLEQQQIEREKQCKDRLPKLRNKNKIVSNLFKADSYDTVVFNPYGMGGVTTVGEGSFYAEWKKYNDIIAIDNSGWQCDVALRYNGTILVSGASAKKYGRDNARYWSDIIAISSGNLHIVGLKSDGTVVAVGDNTYGQCCTNGWKNIIQISAGYNGHTVGLKSDGTVVAIGNNTAGQCEVNSWQDIVKVVAADSITIGVKVDGTVVTAGSIQKIKSFVESWSGIATVDCRGGFVVGLKYDGTVVVAQINSKKSINVSNWSDIIAISASCSHIVGLRADGTLVATGENTYGQCNVSNFKLFDDVDVFLQQRLQIQEKVDLINKQQKIIVNSRREQNLCQHCGGAFKGVFTKKCSSCGKEKDY